MTKGEGEWGGPIGVFMSEGEGEAWWGSIGVFMSEGEGETWGEGVDKCICPYIYEENWIVDAMMQNKYESIMCAE